jgi:hypothetical protein
MNDQPTIREIFDIFQKDPLFQNGYLRFLYQDLNKKRENDSYIYKDGSYLDYHIYKRGNIVRLQRIISKEKGKGNGTRILKIFLSKFKKKKIILKVSTTNTRAILFYAKNGFVYDKTLDKGYFQYVFNN